MQLSNGISELHLAYAHAVYEGFPEYTYTDRDWEHYRKTKEDRRVVKSSRHSEYNIAILAMFSQTWSSTALGFGGMGGQAITSAYVIVLKSNQGAGYCVYFGGRFAYRIEEPNAHFYRDIREHQMADVAEAKKLYEAVE